MGSWKDRGNQYIQFIRVLYCKLPSNGKQLPAFQLEAVLGIEPRPQRWEARVLPLCQCDPNALLKHISSEIKFLKTILTDILVQLALISLSTCISYRSHHNR